MKIVYLSWNVQVLCSYQIQYCHWESSIQNEEECLKFIDPCIANIFSEYNQQDATLLNLFISVRRSTCFRRFFRPSSGARNCTYSVRNLSDRNCCLLHNQQDATFLKFIYFCKTLYMFQTVFPSIIRSSKLHTQRQGLVRTLLLPAASSR